MDPLLDGQPPCSDVAADGNTTSTTKKKMAHGSILHFRSKAFHVAFRLSIRLRFVIAARFGSARPEAFSSGKSK